MTLKLHKAKLHKALGMAVLLAATPTFADNMLPALPSQQVMPALPAGTALPAVPQNLAPPVINGKSAILIDYRTGKILADQNSHEHLAPASLTKIMSAYVIFSAIHDGRLKLNQVVPVSVDAWQTGGSKMFISPSKPVTVDQLIHGMLIQSGNDATVALAEAVAGSQDNFVVLMNEMAQRLGMKDTHYVTVNGLPDPNHYSSAYDVALVSRALIHDFPQFYAYAKELSYTYNGITQGNRNILLPMPGNRYGYPGADGIKTGHTDEAGYCLAGSAVRNGMRLISVVMDTDSGIARATESEKLLNYGFANYKDQKVVSAGQMFGTVRVSGGRQDQVPVVATEDDYMTVPRGQNGAVQTQVALTTPVLAAPVAAGQQVGVLKVSVNGQTEGQYPLVTKQEVQRAGFFRRLWLWILSLIHKL